MSQLYTVKDAAARLGISSSHLYDLIKERQVEPVYLGTQYRITESELERILTGGTSQPQAIRLAPKRHTAARGSKR